MRIKREASASLSVRPRGQRQALVSLPGHGALMGSVSSMPCAVCDGVSGPRGARGLFSRMGASQVGGHGGLIRWFRAWNSGGFSPAGRLGESGMVSGACQQVENRGWGGMGVFVAVWCIACMVCSEYYRCSRSSLFGAFRWLADTTLSVRAICAVVTRGTSAVSARHASLGWILVRTLIRGLIQMLSCPRRC